MDGDTYLFEYEHNGATWSFHVWAADFDDARARLRKMAQAKYLGHSVVIVPAVPGAGIFVRLVCWVRNVLFRRATP